MADKTIGQRIRELRLSLGMSQEELAKSAGYSDKSAINKIELGQRDLTRSKAVTLAKLFGVTPGYLMGWDDEDPNAELYKIPGVKPIKKVRIPMLGKIACGEPMYADEQHETYIETDENINADFCLTCDGDSMEPKIQNGDIVFIRKQEMVDEGQVAAVMIEDEATLKRVYYDRKNNILRLIADNPKYPPFIYTGNQLDRVRILGKAVSLYRHII